MRPLDKRVLAMLAVLLAAQLAAWAARPADGPPAALAADRIPLRAGDWHGRDLGALDAMTLDMLAPDAYLNREYASADGSLAHLAVIFGHLKETFHSPGFCLLGGGWNIVAKSRLAVETGRGAPIVVNRFLLAREATRRWCCTTTWLAPARPRAGSSTRLIWRGIACAVGRRWERWCV